MAYKPSKRCPFCAHKVKQMEDKVHYVCTNKKCLNVGIWISEDDPYGTDWKFEQKKKEKEKKASVEPEQPTETEVPVEKP